MSAQPIPGPMEYKPETTSVHLQSDSDLVAIVYGKTAAQEFAHGNLIAAAGELLFALEEQQRTEDWMASGDSLDPFFTETCTLRLNYCATLRAEAIAKAKGGTP